MVRTSLNQSLKSNVPVEWAISDERVHYRAAEAAMEARVSAIRAGDARELIWLLEHPPLYTAGTSARADDLRLADRFPVYRSQRGGQYTYHGPGQRVVYVMLDLGTRARDVRAFIAHLEDLIIGALGEFNVRADRREDRVGVWVDRTRPGGPLREDKIAAIGVRLRHWISFHGIAINVEPDLSHFGGIVPCGIHDPHFGVTSLVDLGLPAVMSDLDVALRRTFEQLLGPTIDAPPPLLPILDEERA